MTTPMSYTESYISGPQGTQFYTRTYTPPSLPPKALLVFVHGFDDQIGRHTHTHTAIAQHGVAVFVFDQRGFGSTVFKKENGAGKKYAQTSWREQLQDIEWAIKEGRKKEGCTDVPVFLMGHSMGGGLALAFATRQRPEWLNPSAETVSLLSGVISCSPLVTLTHPASTIQRWLGRKFAVITPGMTIPAPIKGEDLSHNPEIGVLVSRDPLIRQIGSLRGMTDMLDGGEQLLGNDYKFWPKDLPLLILHGTADQVTSHKAAQTFWERVIANDKKLSLYEGQYHELHNETDGVQEKFLDEIVTWIEAHLPGTNAVSVTADAKL